MIRSILFAIGLLASAALAQNDVALVVGNSDYHHAGALKNPHNDAALIASALRGLGFDVIEARDLGREDLLAALQDFKGAAIGAETAIIYFAGHGIEVNRENYLIPVDAALRYDTDIPFESIRLDLLLGAVQPASRLRLVILDACRNNPFQARMIRTNGVRSMRRGLAAIEPTANTIVAYAAKEGTVAYDGDEENSPYARALNASLREPGLEIGRLFRKVRDDVLNATGGAQEPFLYGSLSANALYLNPADPTLPENDIRPVELAAWNQALAGGKPDDFALFLKWYPDGPLADFARKRLGTEPGQGEAGVPEPAAVSLSRTEVVSVQEVLTILGFRPGPIDGILGGATSRAIGAFQRSRGEASTGALSVAQHAALLEAVGASDLAAFREARQREAARRQAPAPPVVVAPVVTETEAPARQRRQFVDDDKEDQGGGGGGGGWN